MHVLAGQPASHIAAFGLDVAALVHFLEGQHFSGRNRQLFLAALEGLEHHQLQAFAVVFLQSLHGQVTLRGNLGGGRRLFEERLEQPFAHGRGELFGHAVGGASGSQQDLSDL